MFRSVPRTVYRKKDKLKGREHEGRVEIVPRVSVRKSVTMLHNFNREEKVTCFYSKMTC